MHRRATTAAVVVAVLATLVAAVVIPSPGRAASSPAAITLSPTCGAAGSSPQRYSIQVDGTDFNPILDVIVTFDAGPGGHPESFAATTDGFGRFDVLISPLQRSAGTFIVRADDLREREATASFTVPCVAIPPPPLLCTASLTFDPSVGRLGTVVQLIGTGFPQGVQHITVAWDRGINNLAAIPVGAPTFTHGVLLMSHDLAGTRTLRVIGSDSSTANVACAAATLLVVPGSVQPDTFVVRR